MLLNLMFVPNVGKISHHIGSLGRPIYCGFRRKFTQQIWKEKMNEIIQLSGKIIIIDNEESWENASSVISRDVAAVNAVGFDCEWAQDNGKRKPVALMQLATYSGNCFVVRLSNLQKSIPSSLQEILENRKILKVGVACDLDASHFAEDYNVNVRGWLDLRHLAIKDDLKNCKIGLKSLTEIYLGITSDKHWKLRASDWESSTLTEEQVTYAAEDAIFGIRILLSQLRNLWTPVLEESWETSVCKAIEEVCEPYVEVQFEDYKMKFCFVCGKNDVSTKKNVLPIEYMKYFPKTPELHSDRTCILLCKQCHECYSIKEATLRQKLAEECDAPIGEADDAEEMVERKLNAVNAAKGLKEARYRMSWRRMDSLEEVLKDFYETNEVTDDLINQAVLMDKEVLNEKSNLHGYKVFRYYEKVGLIHLLARWRQLFLDSMEPKYVPKYWPISHSQEFSQFKINMSRYPMDSEVRDFYKLILVGIDGDIDVPYEPDIRVRSKDSSSSDSNEDLRTENELNLASKEQLIDQSYEKR